MSITEFEISYEPHRQMTTVPMPNGVSYIPVPFHAVPPCICEHPLVRIIREQQEEIDRLKNPNRWFQ